MKCQKSGCSRLVHHVCSIEWAASNNLEEVGIAILCREHHPQYCHKFVARAGAIPNPTMRRQTSAEERMQMDAVLAEMGPPPDWSDDTNDSKTGEFGSSAVDDSLKSPEGVEIRRTMPGSAETQMSVGVPNPSERAVTAATTTARAGKKRTIACRKGV